MERAIIHLNIADFAAAVEINGQPALKDRPIVIAPLGAPRAVIHDMNEKAFCQGIRKGMPLARARRLNKKIHILPPNFNRYEKIMHDLLKESLAFTPQVESGQTDGHLFMDVTRSSRLFGPPVDMAFKLKKTFKKHFSLDPIWSLATSKLVAKVATRIVKPSGEYIVAPGDESAFLAPLPLDLIPGLSSPDIRLMHEFNLFAVSQARALTPEQLKIPFENRAETIYQRIRGVDPDPVTALNQTCTRLLADHEFSNDTNHFGMLKKKLYQLVEEICAALRKQSSQTPTAHLILSYSDGLQRDAQCRLKHPTACDMVLFKSCTNLLEKAWLRRVRIRHMRLICQRQQLCAAQGELFSRPSKSCRQTQLVNTMDRIREKFGGSAIRTGLTLTRDPVT